MPFRVVKGYFILRVVHARAWWLSENVLQRIKHPYGLEEQRVNAKPDIIVIGAGPAGMMAAGQAAKRGASVRLVEKMERPGRKLRITGKGRCNITNDSPMADFLRHFPSGGNFLKPALHGFFAPHLLRFLAERGVETVTERGNRVFPASDKAGEVVDALTRWNTDMGVGTGTLSRARALLLKDTLVTGVRTAGPDGTEKELPAHAVIITTGGLSYPLTGSTGDGYRLARAAGHTIVTPRPALAPLETVGDWASRLQGLSLKNVTVSLWVNGKKQDSEFGEILFTHFGVSGPVILTLSGQAVDALHGGKQVELSIDLKPALDNEKLDARLLRDFDNNPKKQAANLLRELLPSSLIPLCLDITGIPADRTANQVTAKDRRKLRLWLKDFRLAVTGHRPISEAIVTAGGVSLKEVNPKTMESRLVKGLYFAGEVLDIHADTGGFNLQAAFSTGYLAGISAAGRND